TTLGAIFPRTGAKVVVIPSRVCRGCSAATESPTRLHTEHPDIGKRVRAQNSVVHKPFACKRESNSRPQLAFSSWNERVFVFSRKRSKRCDKEITYLQSFRCSQADRSAVAAIGVVFEET